MAISKERYTVDKFYGYNHGLKIGSGEFYDMKNLTSSYFPVLSSRHRRAVFSVMDGDIHGLHSKEKLLYVSGGALYYGDEKVEGFPTLSDEYNFMRRIVSMGAYAVIFPDKLYINTADLSDYGSIDACYSTDKQVLYTMCELSGEEYSDYTVGETAPEEPAGGDMWLDTSDSPHILKKYYDESSMWVSVSTTYVKISAPGIGANFAEYDCVTISGSVIEDFNTDMIVWGCEDNYIIVAGLIDEAIGQIGDFEVNRKCPDMDYVCTGENRIWGCNSELNEIYCCKLGDFKNWRCYMGLSSDSYTVSVGSDGDFTGAIRYGSYTLFFKENCIHKVYGTNPPFEIATSYVRGVQKGSDRSLCVVNETLFYKSPTGICAYEGGAPVTISDGFGTMCYDNAVGGSFRDKYYICLKTRTKGELFVYDLNRGLWHKEDEINVVEMANNNNNLYMLIEKENKTGIEYRPDVRPKNINIPIDGVLDVLPTRALYLADYDEAYGDFEGFFEMMEPEETVEWEAVSGLFGLDVPENKYPNRIILRLSVEEGAEVNVSIEYDSTGEWEFLENIKAQKTHGLALPITVNTRCDHFRLKFSGSGQMKLFSIVFNLETGGEIN